MLERARATFKLKSKERCPGEWVCTTDPVNGVVAKMQGETLDSYCKPARCKFYFTKDGSTPQKFVGLFESAMIMREAKLGELRAELEGYEERLPFWSVAAYKAAERAFRVVENENAEGDAGDNLDNFAGGGDSTAFALIEAKLVQTAEQAKARDDWTHALENQPELPQQLIEFMRSNAL